jgi:hypothetical protein
MLLYAVVAAVAFLILLAARVAWVYFSQRGARVVTCPETGVRAGVSVNARRAALSGAPGASRLRLESCTRWPERQACGQECLGQIQAAADGCLIRNLLAAWYAGKDCAVCGRPVPRVDWAVHTPGLLSPQGVQTGWDQVVPEAFEQTLRTHLPVCWSCHITSRFVTGHPDLVTDRSHTG